MSGQNTRAALDERSRIEQRQYQSQDTWKSRSSNVFQSSVEGCVWSRGAEKVLLVSALGDTAKRTRHQWTLHQVVTNLFFPVADNGDGISTPIRRFRNLLP